MKCPYCEQEISKTDRFCPHCDGYIKENNAPAPAPAKPQTTVLPTMKKPRSNILVPMWAYVLLLIAAILIGVGGVLDFLICGVVEDAIWVLYALGVHLFFCGFSIRYRWSTIIALIFCIIFSVAYLFPSSDLGGEGIPFLLVGCISSIVASKKLISAHNQMHREKKIEKKQQKIEKRQATNLGVAFHDIVIGEKDWKAFKKTATEEELFVLAVGAKVMTSGRQFFIKALISVLGTILSLVAGFFLLADEGFFGVAVLVIGYLSFNLMAVKLVSYGDTLSDCRKRLNVQDKTFIDSFQKDKPLVAFLKWLVVFGLTFFTIPYRAILAMVGMLLPQAEAWCVAHGGMGGTVVTLPKGYDVGGLSAVGEYYASQSFMDAWERNCEETKKERLAKMKSYTYEDETGVTQTAYSDDDKNFYSSTDKTRKVGEGVEDKQPFSSEITGVGTDREHHATKFREK